MCNFRPTSCLLSISWYMGCSRPTSFEVWHIDLGLWIEEVLHQEHLLVRTELLSFFYIILLNPKLQMTNQDWINLTRWQVGFAKVKSNNLYCQDLNRNLMRPKASLLPTSILLTLLLFKDITDTNCSMNLYHILDFCVRITLGLASSVKL
jgi:hypothetical protein